MKILFVCKYNAFRSRVAEEYFKKLNKKIDVDSEGLIMGGNSDKEQRNISKELLGINIAKRNPKSLNIKSLEQVDLVIVVANDIPKIIFNYRKGSLMKKIRLWKIKDEQYQNKKNIKKIILAIKKKVETLNEELK